MGDSVNSFIKLDSFPVTDSYSMIMNSHVMELTNLKISVLMELEMEFQEREHEKFLFTTPVVGNFIRPSDVRSIPHPTATCSAPVD